MALVDWDLPGIDGPEMCRLVRDFHHGHDTWLVVLAGSDHRATGEAWRAGADDCVSTPAPAADLRECVEKGLRAMRAARAHRDDSDTDARSTSEPRATLDAVRTPDGGGANDFFGFVGAELRATGEPRDDGLTADAEAAAADEPRGAALLEAVLQQP